MKQFFTRHLLSVFLVVVSAVSTFAQASGTATIDANMVISLNADAPLVSEYTFKIDKVGFKDEAAAVRFFGLCRDNIVNYTVNYVAGTATVTLGLQFTEPRGWGLAEYNNYFQTLAERYRTTLSIVNE